MSIETIITIGLKLIMFAISFYSLQSLRVDTFFKEGHTTQIQLFYLLLSIALAQISSEFFIDLWPRYGL